MAYQNLGRVGLVLKGTWSSTVDYVPLDLVAYDGNAWAAKRNNKNVTPETTNSDDWQLISNNADLVATVQGLKNAAAASASDAADSATAAAASAQKGQNALNAIAPQEASSTASQAYEKGDHFFLGGVLYEATADIAQGGTIVTSWTGKNCETAVLGAEVTHLERGIFSVLSADAATIPDNTDLDSVTDPGNYKVTTSLSAATMTHGPVSLPYRLLVLETTGTSTITQIAIIAVVGNERQLAIRYKNTSDVWSDWQIIVSKAYIDAADATVLDTVNSSLYAGRSESANTLKVLTQFDLSSLESNNFGLADIPRMSYVFTSTASRFTDLPANWNPTGIFITRTNINGAGNISYVVVRNAADPSDGYEARYSETTAFGGWTKLPKSADIIQVENDVTAVNSSLYAGRSESANTLKVLTQFDLSSLESNNFGLADIPRMSYVYASTASRFTDLPANWNPDGIFITRTNINSAGNVSYVVVRNAADPSDGYEARYSETVAFRGWTKLPKSADFTQLASDVTKLANNVEGRTLNLFDKNNANLLKGYFGASATSISSSDLTRSLYIPCKANTDYIISRKSGYYAGAAASSEQVPTVGGSISVNALIDVKTIDGVTYTHIKTSANAAYLVYYYYNGNNHDPSGTDITYLDSIMISEGMEYRPYRSYQTAEVKYREHTPINTYGVFGVKFQRGAANPGMMRTYDAEGLTYRQQTANTIGYSDFDNAFPWCEMRECNVSVDGNGNKTIVYKGETGFSYANNTYVEVPAFYFKRTVVNGMEEWAISGRPFSGADIEPWFVNEDGNIAKYRYIARYEGAALDGGSMSVTGVIPKTNVTPSACKTYCEANGATLMSIEAWFALEHLMVIECCTFNLQAINVGVSYMAYSVSTSGWNKAQNSGTGNTVVLTHNVSDKRLEYLNVGDTVYLSETGAQDLSNPRKITAFTIDSTTQVTIQFDGAAYAVTADTTFCFPAVQPTGRTDSMTYYSGRPLSNAMNSPFQYRGIENPYGNAWTYADGITWRRSDGKFALGDRIPAFTAPYQYESGNDNNTEGWITKLGYDRAIPWATLTETVLGTTSSTGKNKYITDEWNTRPSGTGPNPASVGGGWDHQGENGMFCMRITNYEGGTNWLYGYRAMIN